MKKVNELISKINTNFTDTVDFETLSYLSFNEINDLLSNVLASHEINTLYNEIQKHQTLNKIEESHYLTRSNPQIRNAVSLAIQSPAAKGRALNEWIPERGNEFVDSQSVASMFSPAGYLTELYREAKALHPKNSIYHLDKRRPDLAKLVLSQDNLDKEVSTLSLSNQILTTALQAKLGSGKDIFRELSTYRLTGETPYHQPYEIIRQAILLQDNALEGLMSLPEFISRSDSALLASIKAGISPELYQILIEDVDKDTDTLFKKNFGNINNSLLNSADFISKYYNVDIKNVKILLNLLGGKKFLNNKEILNLNKIIRLFKSTEIPLLSIINLIQSENTQFNINARIVNSLINLKNLLEHYSITPEQAVVLNGGLIIKKSLDNKPSQFDQLFNSLPLNGAVFSDDGHVFDLNNAIKPDDIIRLNTIKHALNVNDIELMMLWKLASGSDSNFENTLVNLSLLYRVHLLAKINGLTINELVLLMNILPDSLNSPIKHKNTSDKMNELINIINGNVILFRKEKWEISELFLICTKKYDDVFTPILANLIDKLRSELKNRNMDYEEQYALVTSFIDMEMGVESIEKAQSILYLIDKNKYNKTLKELLPILIKEDLNDEDKIEISRFFNRVQKVIVIFNKIGLTEFEIKFITHYLHLHLIQDNNKLDFILFTIRSIIGFHHFITQCGDMANDFLDSLINETLTSEKLSIILNVDEKTIDEALLLTPNKELKHYENIYILSKYIELSKLLDISPKELKLLVSLRYSEDSNVIDEYNEWDKISQIMQGSLNNKDTVNIAQIIDDKKSNVLTKYYINKNPNLFLNSDSDVYHYLLIDNKISAEIMTTPIAQAIANIQFYINNCLSGDEKQVNKNTKGRTFFTQWDLFNKRYSTWAGISKLVYYPENYVDPTLRIGQTKMMDTLLQSISQNSVNTDTIEDAFKTYLTSFEQIANLEVISGYHDSVTLDDGMTYFIGRNPSDKMSYYWRSADHSKIKNGKMAANAWTEWTKIENGLNPYNGLIRPVIFNSRLYIAWIERVETAKNKTTENIEQDIKYSLNLSHIRYDGSWSSPVNYALQDDIKNLAHMNFYLSYSEEFDNLMVIFYQMKDKYSLEDTQFEIYYIDNELNFTKGTGNKIEYIYVNAKNEFDILDNSKDSIIRTVNNTFIRRDKVNYSISRDPISSNSIKDSDLASLHGSLINNPKVVLNNNNITCSVSASVKCEIKKSIEVVEQMRNHLNDILSFNGAVQDDFKDIYYAEFKLGTEKEFLIGQPIIHNKYINKVLYLFIDVNKNYIYMYIADEKNDYKLDYDFTKELIAGTSYIGISGAGGLSYDFSKDFVEDKGFFIKNMNGIFDVEKILVQKNFSFNFFMSYMGISYGIYGKGIRDLETLNNLKVVHENISQNIKDIIIELGTTHNQKTYSLNDWSNNTKLSEGDNSFNSKEGKLILDIPDSEFNSNRKTIVTVNIKVKNKQSEILSEKGFSFEVKQIISANESNTIRVKINSAMAQYMSMNIANRPMLVRLNTLFARQLVKRANIGIERILTLDTQRLPEPPLEGNTDGTMDFNGANALYFWELFYYTPMMIANVMLDGQNYDEASRWLRYVFSPNGYIENGIHFDRVWNSQPLLSDTAWDKDQLDSSDPDAVAQTDPMHYKLATFMKCLDILIARGDSAYRVLERDTLNEAKMWYMQALQLLGDETELTGNNIWSSPTLMEAASKIAQPTHAINEKEEETTSPRTANSLTSLFLPQINEKLAQYRDTLKTRLFNLRHNLSIDGQPLSLAIYATPADPKALQNAVVNQSQGGSALPNATMPTQRFPVMLNSAKSVVSQLMQFGNSLANIIERQDAQALSELLTTQGSEIILQNMKYQVKNIEEFTHNEKALNALRAGAQLRLDHYSKLYDENISTSEQQAMDLYLASSVLNTASTGLGMAGAVADLVPNIYGFAVGGSRFGGVFNATSMGLQLSGAATRIAADRLNQSETYRRRREEWKLARDNAKTEVEQFDAQLDALKIRKQAASLQLDTLKLQQQQTQEYLTFLQNKFTNKSLYNWLRGKLMAIYKPFYDLTVSHCCMAELAYQYDLGETQTFIRPGAWQGTYSGLMAGESLMHNLTQMENSYLEKDKRVLEMTKIVSLDDVYQGLGSNKFNFNQVGDVINGKITALGTTTNGITLKNGQLQATIKLSDLAIDKDYPAELGQLRRIKQISVSLPVLVGAYQNIRAVLSYGGSAVKPRGCNAIAISHGMNDSGQFQLNFNDDRYLPFEGIPVNDNSSLTLSFPDATDKQKEMLLTLNDIILHINYTIR